MRTRLLLSVQAAAGIALVVTLVFVWGLGRVGSELDTAQSNALAHEAALSRVLAAQLTSVVGLLHRASVTAARLPSFWDADDTGRDALLAAMTDNALLFDSLAYVAEDLHEHGRSTYSGEAPRLDFSSSPYVREVAATGAPAFGDMTVMPDSNPSVPIVPITVPIHEPTGGRHGYLVAGLRLDRPSILWRNLDLPTGGAVFLFDTRDGRILAGSSDEISASTNQLIDAGQLNRMLTGSQTLQIKGSDDGDTLRAWSPVDGTPWGLAVDMPADMVLGPIYDAAMRQSVSLVIVGLLASGILALAWWRLIRRLGVLRTAARAWTHRDWAHRAALSGSDELAQVGNAFDTMAEQVQQMVGRLEETAERARASERRHKHLVEHARDIIYHTDAGGRFTFVNPVGSQATGFSQSELIGRHYQELIHPDFRRDAVRFYLKQAHERILSTYYEFPCARADGDLVWLGQHVQLVCDDAGQITGFEAIARNITERRQADQRDRVLTAALEASANAIVLTDTDGCIEWANPAFTQLTGYTLDEARGQTTRILRSGQQSAELYAELWQTVKAGRVWQGELVNRRKDGSLYTEEMTITPVRGDHDELTHFVAIKHDISERKVAEARLQGERDFAQLVMNAMGQGLAVTGRDGHFIYVNPALAVMLGCDPRDLVGKSLLEFYPQQNRPQLAELEPRQWGEETGSFDVELRRMDGSPLRALVTVAPRFSGGDFEGRVAVVTDLTEREVMLQALAEARDAALEASRAKGEFLATMSHEIRTPMNGVLGMTELLLDTELSTQQRSYVEALSRSGEALLTLINDILDFSKIEAGKLALEHVDVEVRKVVEDVAELLGKAASNKGVELACLVHHDIPRTLRGDPSRLRQILLNLVGNAVKFTHRGEVVVRARLAEEHDDGVVVRFEVTDTGIGIDPAGRGRLFAPFVQADGSTTRQYGGTGLGLAICRRLVEKMDGEIGVDSELGRGSTFWFTASLAKSSTDEASLDVAQIEGMRVLVVDENSASREMLHEQLGAWCMVVEEVGTATSALMALRAAAVGERPYAICIVDLHVATDDGQGLARAIASDSSLSHTKLVLLGRQGELFDGAEALGPLVTKPIRPSQLFDALVELINDSRDLPSAEHQPSNRVVSQLPKGVRLPRNAGRLLVAEDSTINQMVALGMLAKIGFEADVVANGLEALAALDSTDYAAVLMDCQMPEMDGFQATREIRRRQDSGPRLPVIAMTANAMVGDRERCLAAGMDDYVSKPVRLEELAAALIRCFGVDGAVESGQRALALASDAFDRATLDSLSPALRDALLGIFFEEIASRFERVYTAITMADPVALQQAAHAFKGDAASVGAREIAGLCRELEQCARSGNLNDCTQLVPQLEDAIVRARASNDQVQLSKAA